MFSILNILFLPFYFIYYIFRIVYNIIFFIPITLSNVCENLMGESFFCNVMNPDYIFSNTLQTLFLWTIIVYASIHIRTSYLEWKKHKKLK